MTIAPGAGGHRRAYRATRPSRSRVEPPGEWVDEAFEAGLGATLASQRSVSRQRFALGVYRVGTFGREDAALRGPQTPAQRPPSPGQPRVVARAWAMVTAAVGAGGSSTCLQRRSPVPITRGAARQLEALDYKVTVEANEEIRPAT